MPSAPAAACDAHFVDRVAVHDFSWGLQGMAKPERKLCLPNNLQRLRLSRQLLYKQPSETMTAAGVSSRLLTCSCSRYKSGENTRNLEIGTSGTLGR